MQYKEIGYNDIPCLFEIRSNTRENRLSLEQLTTCGITTEFIRIALSANMKGWLCEIDGKSVGFAMGNKDNGEIFVVAILPEYESRGIGKRLLRLVEEWLHTQGHKELWLTTSPVTRSFGFYQKCGWHQSGPIDGEDVIMKKIFA